MVREGQRGKLRRVLVRDRGQNHQIFNSKTPTINQVKQMPNPKHVLSLDQFIGSRLRRYNDRVKVGSQDDCWVWDGAVNRHGYGKVMVKGITFGAHRIAYMLANGEMPRDKEILHSCDNPPCCNPFHLKAGTHSENMAERDVRKRLPRGEKHPNARITNAQADSIFKMGLSQSEIARALGLHQCTVSRILNGKRRSDTTNYRKEYSSASL